MEPISFPLRVSKSQLSHQRRHD
ncbi:hypothetical protein CKAH01_07062 [Colletotrichum kahawae]|uniref:Uncharacterized protein n=1 Tax=Colletotrichum kahawae TaxID=34407 RepID=A0AAD9Y8D3_COLKA|nr:hypothetical protein CKAH01_07062 [Colletotrichum kahawae]